jgi:hypothetical protein
MAYDKDLAMRIRLLIGEPDGLGEKRMFGGLAFLIHGNMAVSASGPGGLMLRVDPSRSEEYVDGRDGVRVVMRGKEMDGWLRVGVGATQTDEQLARWIEVGIRYAASLPPKKK